MRHMLYIISLVALLGAWLGLAGPAVAGGPINSGDVAAGVLSGPGFSETWTFSGTTGDRVLITAITTSGAANTVTRLRTPGGTEVIGTSFDRNEFQLTATGTWTIVVEESGLNDAGTYNLGLLNVTAGPLTSGTDPNGGPIASAEVQAGQTNQAADFDAFTFTGAAGQRILFSALATAGASYNTAVSVYPPGGGAAEVVTSGGDQVDFVPAASGTYTAVIEDVGDNDAGSYAVTLLNLAVGPLSSVSDPDGGTIASAEVKSANFTTAPDYDAWQFTGTSGDRVLIAAVNTSPGAQNTQVYLYPPSGAAVSSSTFDRLDYQLNATGTWTIVVIDAGLNDTGSYNLSLLNLTSGPLSSVADPDGGPVVSAERYTGQANQTADFDAFTFTGAAGQRILFSAVATGGAAFNTTISIYPPGGGVAETVTSGGDQVDLVLASSGTYTAVIEDVGDNDAGSYAVMHLNLTAGPLVSGSDPDGGTIASAEVKSATFATGPDYDAWRFTGSSGDRVLLVAVNTSPGTQNTQIYLYPPSGAAVSSSTFDRLDYQLNATGTWTVVVVDAGLDDTGAYSLSLLNVPAGPLSGGGDPDGGALASAEVKSGQSNQAADFDAFTFTGAAGQRILFAAVATGGATYNTTISIYPPGGGAAETVSSGGDQVDRVLAASGTYTAVIEDVGDNDAGSYSVTLLNLAVGPLTSGSDLDGGTITSAEVKSATCTTVPDYDAWQFSGTNGDRVLITAVNTSAGTQNTQIYLYPPAGAAVSSSTFDRLDYQLNATGTWTIVVVDAGMDDTGSYNLSLLNLTAGPLVSGADSDGGPIASAELKTGQTNQAADFDAFTFAASAGERILFSALATGGAAYNTTISIYPPGGGAAETVSGGGDQVDLVLAASGTYTAVIEDVGDNDAGSYAITLLNLTSGPLSSASDPDGGTIVSAEVKSATFATAPDYDAWQFSGTNGDRVLIAAVNTSPGTQNTQIYLYPPSGAAVSSSTFDRLDYQLNATGTWTIVVIDAGLNDTGSYNLSLLNLTSGPLEDGIDADGGPMVSAERYTGQVNQATDFDAFTFGGFAGERVLVGAILTGGGAANTTISLYPPYGNPVEVSTGGGDRLDAALQATGTYTVVIEDAGNNDSGSYALSFLALSAGPLNSEADPDGGTLVTPGAASGSISPAADFDAYRFSGSIGDTVHVSAVATAGTLNTMIRIYPFQGAAVVATSFDNVTYVLTSQGLHTIVIEDAGMVNTGTYNVTFTGSGGVTGVPAGPAFDRTRVVLQAPAPNPSTGSATLAYSVPTDTAVKLRVFDATGRLVRTLADDLALAGRHECAWDGRDDAGTLVAGGTYYLDLRAGSVQETRKIVRLR